MLILCVHQGYELYGSDRCFVESVNVIRQCFPSATIRALIPKYGPLAPQLASVVDEVRVTPLCVLRKRDIIRLIARAPYFLPLAVARAVMSFRRSDLVYISTVVTLDYMLAARFFRKKALLHVHEAPEGIFGGILRGIVRSIRVPTIFNSKATRDAYFQTGRPGSSYVLYNGIAPPVDNQTCNYDGSRRLRVLMLGRLSRGKGQDILINACRLLPSAIRQSIEVRVVGSSFETQTALEDELFAQARLVGDGDTIRFEPFVAETSSLYNWCDIVVVPSRVREGFGRVAVEAMAHGRACIVAAQGGLVEIVVHDQTGWWFTPQDPASLAAALETAVEQPALVRAFGSRAKERFERCFTRSAVDLGLRQILEQQVSHHRCDCRGTP